MWEVWRGTAAAAVDPHPSSFVLRPSLLATSSTPFVFFGISFFGKAISSFGLPVWGAPLLLHSFAPLISWSSVFIPASRRFLQLPFELATANRH
jgi:hypothetical protein